MAAGSAAVLTNFIINLCVCIGCYVAFSLLRVRPWARRFFASRRFAKDIDLKPKRLPNLPLSWVYPVMMYPEEQIIDECGLDCAIYLRILRFGLFLFTGVALWTIIAVLPVNLTGGAIRQILAEQDAQESAGNVTVVNGRELKFTNFDRYSLANVAERSSEMWVHLISVYAVGLYTLWLLWRFNKESVLLRLMFLGNSQRGGPSHTVLVTDIPGVTDAVAAALKVQRESDAAAAKLSRANSRNAGCQTDVDPSDVELGGLSTQQSTAVVGVAVSHTGSKPTANGKATANGRATANGKANGVGNGHHPPPPPSAPPPPPPAAPPPPPPAGPSRSPFADPNADPYTDTVDGGGPGAAGPHDEELGTAKSSGKLKGGLSKVFGASASAHLYRLVDPTVDPKYAATGGKLEVPRVGMTTDEILAELERVEPEDIGLTIPGRLGVDTRPDIITRRTTKRYKYDITDISLDSTFQAKEKLKQGVTPQQLVAREFALVYTPQNVAAVNMIQDTSALEPLVAEYNKLHQALDDYLDMAQLRIRLRKGLPHKTMKIWVRLYGEWGIKKYGTKGFHRVDAMEFWLDRLFYLRERIIEEQRIAQGKVAAAAFVTLNTRMAQSVGSNSLHFHDEVSWRVVGAPAAFELVWANLRMKFAEKNARLYLLWVVFWLMALFFMIPVTAIQGIIEVPKLAKIPVLGSIVTAPAIRQLIEAIIPGLALKIFLAIVPIILRIMAKLSGALSASEIDFGVVSRFFLFQVIVVFFGNIIAGSFFNQVTVWVKDPGSIVPTLGKSIPMTSTFFVTYVLINGLGVKSIQFIRLPGFVIYWILSKFAGSPKARQRLWMYQYTDNGTTVVDHTIVCLLGLTFSCINPIMSVAAMAYYLVVGVGERYNNIYVFRRQYESAGRLWKTVYNQVMVALYIQQLTMTGLFALKRFTATFVMIPLIIFTFASHVSTLRLFARPWALTSLHDAADLDIHEADNRRMELLRKAKEERKAARKAIEQKEGKLAALNATIKPGPAELMLKKLLGGNQYILSSDEKKAIEEMYRNPCFTVDLTDLEAMQALAEDTRARLDILNAWVESLKKAGKKPAPPPMLSGPLPSKAGSEDGASSLGSSYAHPPPELTVYDHAPVIDPDVHED